MTRRMSLLTASVMLALGTGARAAECESHLSDLDARVIVYESESRPGDGDWGARVAELRTLVDAAYILRRTGRSEACSAALSEVADRVAAIERPAVLPVERLLGGVVETHGGDEIGSVEHVVFHREQASFPFAVLRIGGVLGLGGELKPVPVDALHPTADEGRFELAMDRAQIEGAPGYDEVADDPSQRREWLLATHRYFELSPPRTLVADTAGNVAIERVSRGAASETGSAPQAMPAADPGDEQRTAAGAATRAPAVEPVDVLALQRLQRRLSALEDRLGTLRDGHEQLAGRVAEIGATVEAREDLRTASTSAAGDGAPQTSENPSGSDAAVPDDDSETSSSDDASGAAVHGAKARQAIEVMRGRDDPYAREVGEAGGGGEVAFRHMDSNRDGVLSVYEASADFDLRYAYEDLDANDDERIDRSEFQSFDTTR